MIHNTYALIDGVMHQTAIKDLYKSKEPIQVIPLYIGTRFQENYELGPILVAALKGSLLINEIKQNWSNSATLIQSTEYLSVIAEHLKQLITVTDETGSNSLFRFADPLTTWYWLNSYQQNALPDVLGPINQWQITKPIPDWQPQITEWHTVINPHTAPLKLPINYLNETQVQALDEAADFRFKNKMYQWLQREKTTFFQNKQPDYIGNWLDTCVNNAKQFNLHSERSIAIWIVLCADYGMDFATIPNGIYHNWFKDNPQYKGLPPEVNIQNFYNSLVNQPLTEAEIYA